MDESLFDCLQIYFGGFVQARNKWEHGQLSWRGSKRNDNHRVGGWLKRSYGGRG